MCTDKKVEIILEKAAALSMRPSQYAGWEIGSTAEKTGEAARRIALVCPRPYEKAMQDDCLLDLYGGLAACCSVCPERIFLPGQDYLEKLAFFGETRKWFSLESKAPLEFFDDFILFPGAGADGDLGRPASQPHSGGLGRLESQRDVTSFGDGSTAGGLGRPASQSFGDGSTAGGLGRRLEQAVRDLCRDSQKRLWEAALINQGAGQSGASDIMGRLGLEAGTGNLPLIAYHSWERTFAAAGPAQDAGGRRIYAGTARRTASLRARLVRHGWSRFVSHLEQIQIFKNAVLLAGLPAARSRTKKPRLKMSFGPAVGVGWESSSEFFDIMLEEPVQIETFSERLKSCLPLGYELGWVGRIPVYFPSLEESANRADFWIEEKYEPGGVDWQRLFEWFRRLSQEGREPLIVKKEKPGKKIDLINVAEIVAAVSLGISQSGGNVGVKLSLRYGPKKNLKPEKILEISLGLTPEFIETRLRICRTALALESRDGRLRYL